MQPRNGLKSVADLDHPDSFTDLDPNAFLGSVFAVVFDQ